MKKNHTRIYSISRSQARNQHLKQNRIENKNLRDKEKLAQDREKLSQDREKLSQDREKLSQDREKLAQDREKLAQDSETIMKNLKNHYFEMRKNYTNTNNLQISDTLATYLQDQTLNLEASIKKLFDIQEEKNQAEYLTKQYKTIKDSFSPAQYYEDKLVGDDGRFSHPLISEYGASP